MLIKVRMPIEIKKISFKELFRILGRSINYGKHYYFTFLLGTALALFLGKICHRLPLGSLVNMIFAFLWFVGWANVSQIIVEKKENPQVSDFFVVFYRSWVFKRIIPIFPIIFLFLVLSSSLITFCYLLAKLHLSSEYIRSGTPFVSLICIPIVGLFITPVSFFMMLLIFQNKSWRTALRNCGCASLKNWFWIIALAAPCAIYVLFIAAINYDPPSWLSSIFHSEMFPVIMKYSEWVSGVPNLLITPFFVTFYYLLYNEIFAFPQPNNNLESAL